MGCTVSPSARSACTWLRVGTLSKVTIALCESVPVARRRLRPGNALCPAGATAVEAVEAWAVVAPVTVVTPAVTTAAAQVSASSRERIGGMVLSTAAPGGGYVPVTRAA